MVSRERITFNIGPDQRTRPPRDWLCTVDGGQFWTTRTAHADGVAYEVTGRRLRIELALAALPVALAYWVDWPLRVCAMALATGLIIGSEYRAAHGDVRRFIRDHFDGVPHPPRNVGAR